MHHVVLIAAGARVMTTCTLWFFHTGIAVVDIFCTFHRAVHLSTCVAVRALHPSGSEVDVRHDVCFIIDLILSKVLITNTASVAGCTVAGD